MGAYQRFIDILDSKSPETKAKYISNLNYYLKFLNVDDPDSLFNDVLLTDLKSVRKVQGQIIGYINHMKKLNLSHSTISSRWFAIQKFYVANEVNLNNKYIAQFLPQNEVRRMEKAYSSEDIQKTLNSTKNERDKVMIYLMASTGMRVGALRTLTIGNLTKVYLHVHSLLSF